MRKKLLALLFLLSATAAIARAEGLRAAAETLVSPSTTVAFGQELKITLSVESQAQLAFSSPPVLAASEWLLLQAQPFSATQNAAGNFLQGFELRVLPLDLGDLVFPSLELPVTDGSARKTLSTPPAKIRVTPTVGQDGKPLALRDIYGPIHVPLSPWVVAGWTLLGLALLAAAYFIWKRWKARPRAAEPTPQELQLAAEEAALQKLLQAEQKFRSTQDALAFFVELSLLFRQYLSDRFGVDALEKTTSEIYAALRAAGVGGAESLQMKEWLSDWDLVKFAKWTPEAAHVEKDLLKIRDWLVQKQKDNPALAALHAQKKAEKS